MFTGLVEQVGEIRRREPRGGGLVIEVHCGYLDLRVGESVAVNGACLTATRVRPQYFEADVSAETAQRTSLARLVPGSAVNLERALRFSDRLGGHLVTGHIDGLGRVVSIDVVGDARRAAFRYPVELSGYVAPKGSVTLDGVSLTVNEVDTGTLAVMIVPHTWANTTLHRLAVGAEVNLEVDLMARYVARLLSVGAVGVQEESSADDRLRAALERAGLI